MRWHGLAGAAIAAGVAAMLGCQTTPEPRASAAPAPALPQNVLDPASEPEMTLAEARALAARYTDAGARPPPRGAGDLRASLEIERRVPEACPAGREASARVGSAPRGPFDDVREASRAASTGRFSDAIDRLLEPDEAPSGTAQRLDAAIRAAARARIYAATGDVDAARGSLEEALGQLARAGGRHKDPATVGYMALARAGAAQAAGRLAEAEARYRQALATASWAAAADTGPDLAAAGADLSANLLAQSRAVDAEQVARATLARTLESYRTEGNARQAGLPATALARALLAQGRADDARFVAERALNFFEADCADPRSLGLALASRTLARTLGELGDWAGVMAVFERAFERLAGDAGAFRRLYGTAPELGLALVHVGRREEGLAHLRGLVTRLGERHGRGSDAALEAIGFLGLAEIAAGERERALGSLRRATEPYRLGQRFFDATTGMDGRLRKVVAGYAALLAELAGRGGDVELVDEYFRVAQLRRLAGVQRAFGPALATGAATTAPLRELAARAETTRRKLATVDALLRTTAMAPLDQLDAEIQDRLRERAEGLSATRAALAEVVDARFGRYRALLRPAVLGIDEVQELMGPGEALVVFDLGAARGAVWAVPFSGPAAYAPLDSGEVAERAEGLREALDPGPIKRPRDLPAFDAAGAHELYRLLLSEVASGWRAASHLMVVADGVLARLPLGVLVTAPVRTLDDGDGARFSSYRRVAWLAREYPISVLPAVTALIGIEREVGEPTGGGSFAGFANPWFSERQADRELDGAGYLGGAPVVARRRNSRALELRRVPATREAASAGLADLPALPGSEEEVRALVVAVGDDGARVFAGAGASEHNATTADLARKRVLAFATHALAPGDLDGLEEPALALSAPGVTGDDGDGLLAASEVATLRLDAEWALLSGSGTRDARAENALAALARVLSYAGARSTLASRWPVHVPAAEAFAAGTLALEVDDPGLSRAEIAQRAALALIDHRVQVDDGVPVFSYAHPIFWAAFSLYGDGRGGMR